MDDQRMRRRLEAADGPVRPSSVFSEDLFAELVTELGLDDGHAAAGPHHRAPALVSTRRRADSGGWWMIAAAVAALLLLTTALGAGAALRWLNAVPPPVVRPADGTLRIAVRPDSPQVGASGTAFGGFDVDVADELGRRLGRQVRLVILAPAQMAADPSAWDIALPSATRLRVTSPDGGDVALSSTRPYYWWPSFLVVRAGAPATLDTLAGARVCVVASSDGEAWATGRERTAESSWQTAPSGLRTVSLPDDGACLDSLEAGDVDAAVTATMTGSDVTSRAGITLVGDGPVALEARGALVRDDGAAGPLGVLVAQALDSMRADGTLSEFATRRFGGDDLSVTPAP